MGERPKKNEPPQFLSGWKEIANYLGKGVRTVQRYERLFGLPVRRPAGKAWGSVLATKSELDAWFKASPIRDEFPLRDPQPEYINQARSIRDSVAQMLRLRDQMFALRAEVRNSVKTLHDSLANMRTEMNRRLWESSNSFQQSSLYTREETELLEESNGELLAAPVRYSKAS